MKSKVFGFVILILIMLFLQGVALANAQGIPVQVIQPTVKTIESMRKINGILEPKENVVLSARVGGVIEEIKANVGQKVKKGEVLVVFDCEQLQIQIKQAEAAVELAQANLEMLLKGASEEDRKLALTSYQQAVISYESAQKNLDLVNKILDDRSMQKQQLLTATTQLEAQEVQLKLAEERYKQAELGYKVAKDDFERMSYLFENGVITPQQYQGIEAQLKNAESALSSAQLAREQARVAYDGALEGYALAKEVYDNRLTAEQQMNGALTQLELAKVSLKIAETNLDKINKGASPEQLRISKANVKQAEAALELVKLQLENSVITSPINGVIAQVNLDEGEMAGPGTPVVAVINIDQVYLKIDVTGDVVTSLQVGQKVGVKILALANGNFEGVSNEGMIELISPVVDPRTQAYPVKIFLENQNQLMKPGMFGEATLTLDRSQNGLVLPIEAVLDLETAPYLYVVKLSGENNGIAEKRSVKVGLVNDREVEIIKGLKEEEMVVCEGQFTIHDGDLVEVRKR